MKHHFLKFPSTPESLPWEESLCKSCLFCLCCWQDIVQDERSDKEETESDDDGEELREKSKNGHMQNGHTPFNNNHRKRKWLDFDRLCDDGRDGVTTKLIAKYVARAEGQQAAHANIHTRM